MKIEVFALCDAAEDWQGRLSLFGTYERIGVPHLPVELTDATIALRLRFPLVEGGIHSFSLHCVDPDGRPAMEQVTCSLHINSFPDTGSAACNLIIRLPAVTVQEFGEHSFDFYLDGRMAGRLPVCIHSRAAPSCPGIPSLGPNAT
jgi:hypothetical protein